jgi:hypothetical protein
VVDEKIGKDSYHLAEMSIRLLQSKTKTVLHLMREVLERKGLEAQVVLMNLWKSDNYAQGMRLSRM